MILNGGMVTLGSSALQPRPCRASNNSNILYFSRCSYSRARDFVFLLQNSILCTPEVGWATSHSSIGFSVRRGDHGKLPSMLQVFHKFHTAHPRNRMAPRASKDVPTSFQYPAMTKKPRWWWRVLACIPYLMPFHETWMYAETAYHLHPFLEDFEFLTYPFLRVIGRLPGWFLMAYFFTAYLGIVRMKEWPHFFRFHVAMGMLLEIALQVVGSISRWMPLSVYWGKIGIHFWAAFAFGYLFTVLECMRCAIAGMYADVPFVCDGAYIRIPYD